MNDNPYDQFDAPAAAPPSMPVITDDGSNWANQPAPKPQANPYDQFDSSPRGQPTWSSSALSLAPISQYADGSYGFDSNAGMLGAGKRFVQGAYDTVTGLPALARQTGAETAANTATPGTAGKVANAAALTTPGDMMAPELPKLGGSAVRAKVETPSESELFKTGGADLNAARDSGVDYSIPHAVNLSNTAEQAIYNQGIGPADAQRTFAKLAEARDVPPDAVSMPINGLMGARRGFSKLTADKQASDMDRAAAAIALGHYQGFLENPPPEAVLAGPASTASDLVAKGNANYAAGARSNLVTNKEQSADLRTGSNNSGRNYDNTIRQKFRPLVDPDDPRHNIINSWTDPEQQALQDVVKGTETRTQNALRTVGNLGAGGHGIASSMLGVGTGMLGEHMLGPAGATLGFIPPIAGSVARTMQNSTARNAVENLGERLRQRSPLYQERVSNAPFTTNTNARGITAVRAGMAQPLQGQPNQPQYAKGGKVKKPSHEFLVNRLMALAEKAKRAEKKATAPILNMPDDTVTAALAKAQEAI